MPIKKHKIVLDLEYESLKELRKVLFSRGLSVQGFLSYVAELVSIRDPQMDSVLEGAVNGKEKRHKKNNKADAESLYALIEQELEKKQQNGA
jgi:hypothetical protein